MAFRFLPGAFLPACGLTYFGLQRSWVNYYTLIYQGWEEALSKFKAKIAEIEETNPETESFAFEKFLSILCVEARAKMLHSFMDTLKNQRDFWENTLINNPALPFVYRTEIDTFHQRMHELRRKISALEKRTRNETAISSYLRHQ